LRVVVDRLRDRLVQALEDLRAVDGGGGPGVRHEESRVAQPVLCVHRAHGADAQPTLLEVLPHLRVIVLDDVAEPENTMLGKRLAGVRRDPLDPGLELLVNLFRFRQRVSMPFDEIAKCGQISVTDIGTDEIEIDLVEFEKQQRPFSLTRHFIHQP
jgi:hypothetical protein